MDIVCFRTKKFYVVFGFLILHLGIYLTWMPSSILANPLSNEDDQLSSIYFENEQDSYLQDSDRDDFEEHDITGNRITKRYTLSGSKWITPVLTYNISRYSLNFENELTKEAIDEIIEKSFSLWSKVTKLRFLKVSRIGHPDIDIRFEVGKHAPCSYQFDGRRGVLAHASKPTKGGSYIHFDDDEDWIVDKNSSEGRNLFHTAVHEIGHVLGITHPDFHETVMSANLIHFKDFHLYEHDVKAISALYANFDNSKQPCSWKEPSQTVKKEPLAICKESKASVKAIFQSEYGNIYAFLNDDLYVELGPHGPIGGVRSIADKWEDLPSNIDAAFTDPVKHFTIFFKDNQYWRMTKGKKDEGYPKYITESFPGGPEKVDAASVWLGFDGFLYLFQGSRYWAYPYTEFNKEPYVDTSESNKESKSVVPTWKEAPDDIDAALSFDDAFYLFRGEYYALFKSKDFKTNRFNTVSLNEKHTYPKKLVNGWFSCDPNDPLEITAQSSYKYIDNIDKVPGLLHDIYLTLTTSSIDENVECTSEPPDVQNNEAENASESSVSGTKSCKKIRAHAKEDVANTDRIYLCKNFKMAGGENQ